MPEDDPEATAEAVVLPSEEWDQILATIADGEEARILLKVVKRRRRSRQEGLSEDSE